jgi:hypothetical protein
LYYYFSDDDHKVDIGLDDIEVFVEDKFFEEFELLLFVDSLSLI